MTIRVATYSSVLGLTSFSSLCFSASLAYMSDKAVVPLEVTPRPSKSHWIGLVIQVPLDVIVQAERFKTLNHKHSVVLKRPEHHITLSYGFVQDKYDAALAYVKAQNFTTADVKFGEVYYKDPPHLKAKREAVICVKVISPKIEKAKDELDALTGAKDPGKEANGGVRIPPHLTMMYLQTPDEEEGEDAATANPPKRLSPKRADQKNIDDNPSSAKKPKTTANSASNTPVAKPSDVAGSNALPPLLEITPSNSNSLNWLAFNVHVRPVYFDQAIEKIKEMFSEYEIIEKAGEGKAEPPHVSVLYGTEEKWHDEIIKMAKAAEIREGDYSRVNFPYIGQPSYCAGTNTYYVILDVMCEKMSRLKKDVQERFKWKNPTEVDEKRDIPLHVTLYIIKGTLKPGAKLAFGHYKKPNPPVPGLKWTERVKVYGAPLAPNDLQTIDAFWSHSPCMDGLYCWMLFTAHAGNRAEYRPYLHTEGKNFGQGLPGVSQRLAVLDACPITERLRVVAKSRKRVVIIDHHPEAIEAARHDLPDHVTLIHSSSTDFCGATLLWEIIHSHSTTPRPLSLRLTELSDTKPIEEFSEEDRCLVLWLQQFTRPLGGSDEFQRFPTACRQLDEGKEGYKVALAEGKVLLDDATREARKNYDKGTVQQWKLFGYPPLLVQVVPFDHLGQVRYMFEIAGKEGKVQLMAAYPKNGTKALPNGNLSLKVMLRSTDTKKWDAGGICKQFWKLGRAEDGGGHPAAAGMNLILRGGTCFETIHEDVDLTKFSLTQFPADFKYPVDMPHPYEYTGEGLAPMKGLYLHAAYRANCSCNKWMCSDDVLTQSVNGCYKCRHTSPGKTGAWIGWSLSNVEDACKGCPSYAAYKASQGLSK